MTVLTVTAATVVITAGAATPAAAGVAAGVIQTAACGGGTAATVAGAAGGGAAAGTIIGAAGGTAAAATGAVAGASAGAAVTSTSAGAAGLAATGVAMGPVGWLVLGSDQESSSKPTFDCWKPVLHDESPEPSDGKLLRDVVIDPLIKRVIVSNDSPLPEIILENVWNEKFLIQYVNLPSQGIALHALPY